MRRLSGDILVHVILARQFYDLHIVCISYSLPQCPITNITKSSVLTMWVVCVPCWSLSEGVRPWTYRVGLCQKVYGRGRTVLVSVRGCTAVDVP